ncbi:unnamed protein product [Ixodes pacificus]
MFQERKRRIPGTISQTTGLKHVCVCMRSLPYGRVEKGKGRLKASSGICSDPAFPWRLKREGRKKNKSNAVGSTEKDVSRMVLLSKSKREGRNENGPKW